MGANAEVKAEQSAAFSEPAKLGPPSRRHPEMRSRPAELEFRRKQLRDGLQGELKCRQSELIWGWRLTGRNLLAELGRDREGKKGRVDAEVMSPPP